MISPDITIACAGYVVELWLNVDEDDGIAPAVLVNGIPSLFTSWRIEAIDLPEEDLVALDIAVAEALANHADTERANGAPLRVVLALEEAAWLARQASGMARAA